MNEILFGRLKSGGEAALDLEDGKPVLRVGVKARKSVEKPRVPKGRKLDPEALIGKKKSVNIRRKPKEGAGDEV